MQYTNVCELKYRSCPRIVGDPVTILENNRFFKMLAFARTPVWTRPVDPRPILVNFNVTNLTKTATSLIRPLLDSPKGGLINEVLLSEKSKINSCHMKFDSSFDISIVAKIAMVCLVNYLQKSWKSLKMFNFFFKTLGKVRGKISKFHVNFLENSGENICQPLWEPCLLPKPEMLSKTLPNDLQNFTFRRIFLNLADMSSIFF